MATRVVAEDENGQLIDNEAFTGLFYVHGDHLGSATALSYGQDRPGLAGTLVPDSVARFLPFGGYRGAKPQTNPAVSDRGFTGHKHNDDLGLVYMNARYYVPSINRFASADTIVPDPMNPQGFNRYSYVYNNPVKYSDPTGHCVFTPFDFVFCALIGITAAVHYAYHEAPNVESLPAETESVNLLTVSGLATDNPNVSGGVGVGGATIETQFYHFESDTMASSVCKCSGLASPNLGTNYVEIGIGRTDFKTAAEAAAGYTKSVNVGMGPLGYTYSTAVRESQPILPGSVEDQYTPMPQQGTTIHAFSFSESAAPINYSNFICACFVSGSGSFSSIPNPLDRVAIEALDSLYDRNSVPR